MRGRPIGRTGVRSYTKVGHISQRVAGMVNFILDYSDFIEDIHSYERSGPLQSVSKTVLQEPDDLALFYQEAGICPFCRQAMAKTADYSRGFCAGGNDFTTYMTVWECPSCGWWECSEENVEASDFLDRVDEWIYNRVRRAVVRRFEVSDSMVPVSALVEELARKKFLLYEVHPRKLEEIAQHVFSAFYRCKVEHVGRSHDGGVDLVIVQADEPILVQVKRRAAHDYTESVSVVREFIGAMYLNDAAQGIVLSTAKQFSREARNDARRVVESRKFKHFELMDFLGFCRLLDAVKNEKSKGWYRFVPNPSWGSVRWKDHLKS